MSEKGKSGFGILSSYSYAFFPETEPEYGLREQLKMPGLCFNARFQPDLSGRTL